MYVGSDLSAVNWISGSSQSSDLIGHRHVVRIEVISWFRTLIGLEILNCQSCVASVIRTIEAQEFWLLEELLASVAIDGIYEFDGHALVVLQLQELPKKQDCSKRRLKLRCMLPRLLHLALTSNSGNREADLGVSAELKELVLRYARSLGVLVEDLGVWLSEIVTSSNYEVLTYPNHVEFSCI